MRPKFLDNPTIHTRTARTSQTPADYASAIEGPREKPTGYSTAWWIVMTLIAIGATLAITLDGRL